MEQQSPGSAIEAKQGKDAIGGETRQLWWAEASIWTDRMVSALGNGVKGGKWFSLIDKAIRPATLEAAWRLVSAGSIDRETLRQTVWYGYGDIVYGPISPVLSNFFTADLPRYPHNPRLANDLLDAAGRPRSGDGTRFRVTLDYRPWTEGDKRTARYLRQALARVGIDAIVRSQDFAAYAMRIYTDRALDFAANSMTNTFDPTIGVQRLYWSTNFKPGVPFSNASHYINPKLDQVLEAASVEIDPIKRRALPITLQTTVARDLPDISFLTDYHYSLFNRRVFDHTTQATGISSNLADVWLG